MSATYIILVHHKPAQFAGLLEALIRDGDRAVVHVDAKSDLQPFIAAAAAHGDAVLFTQRFNVRWGNFAMVDATIAALRDAVRSRPADHYVVLSGADYPIKPTRMLHDELASGAVYMECYEMPHVKNRKPLSRLQYFYVATKRRDSLVALLLNEKILPRLPKRNIERGLGGARPYAGSQWWAVPHACALQMLDYIDSSPRLVRFYRHTRVPDEMFFQTVVKALPDQWEIRRTLTYDDWSRPEVQVVSPATLGLPELGKPSKVPHYFARKFDLDRDPQIFEVIRRTLLEL